MGIIDVCLCESRVFPERISHIINTPILQLDCLNLSSTMAQRTVIESFLYIPTFAISTLHNNP